MNLSLSVSDAKVIHYLEDSREEFSRNLHRFEKLRDSVYWDVPDIPIESRQVLLQGIEV